MKLIKLVRVRLKVFEVFARNIQIKDKVFGLDYWIDLRTNQSQLELSSEWTNVFPQVVELGTVKL